MIKTAKNPADYILPLYINGLNGRMLRMLPKKTKKREILFIYGHHASLERYFGVADLLNRYGGVTVPDLPGFGGMEPFYKIGEKSSLDNMADYLAAFIKLRFNNKRFTLAGYSLGTVVITKMLQKHPELTKRVDLLVSIAGFTHRDDFNFTKTRYWTYRIAVTFFSLRLPAAFFKHVILRPIFIRLVYRHTHNAKQKFSDKEREEIRKTIDMEIDLWRNNDPRTYMATAKIMFTLDLTDKHVMMPIYHAGVENDHYFNNLSVEQHMRTIFSDFHLGKIKSPSHAPSVIATAKDASFFIPKSFIPLLKNDI